MTNAELKTATDALAELLQPTNRLPISDLMRATRAYKAYTEAWAPAEEVRLRMITERGTEQPDGSYSVEQGDMAGFLADMEVLLGEEVDTPTTEPFSLSGGYTKDESGRVALDVSAGSLIALLDAGLVK